MEKNQLSQGCSKFTPFTINTPPRSISSPCTDTYRLYCTDDYEYDSFIVCVMDLNIIQVGE